jgi:hypothetical protein
MDATRLPTDLNRRGITLTLRCSPSGDKLLVSPRRLATPEVMQLVTRHKPALMGNLAGGKPPCPHCRGLDAVSTPTQDGRVAVNCRDCGFFFRWGTA